MVVLSWGFFTDIGDGRAVSDPAYGADVKVRYG